MTSIVQSIKPKRDHKSCKVSNTETKSSQLQIYIIVNAHKGLHTRVGWHINQPHKNGYNRPKLNLLGVFEP